MNIVKDKIILFVIALMFVYSEKNLYLPVVALLLSLIVSLLSQCFFKTKLSAFMHIFYSAICILNPFFCMTLPMIFYDEFREKRKYIVIISLFCILINFQFFSWRKIFFISTGILISYFLESKTEENENLKKNLIESNDTSREINLFLTQKNKQLCENQDVEIHLATLKERNRIAREIHDNVGHMLTRTILQIGALKVINKDKTVGEGLDSIKNTLDEAMTSVRKSVHDLHDESVDLRGCINDSVKSVENKFTVKKSFDFSDLIPHNVKYALIGIVKEGLNNCVKHSNGNEIFLSIQEHPGFYQLVIEDNGTNSHIPDDNGIGLSNMRERVKNLGGIIRIIPDKNFFRIFVTIPKEKNYENCSD